MRPPKVVPFSLRIVIQDGYRFVVPYVHVHESMIGDKLSANTTMIDHLQSKYGYLFPPGYLPYAMQPEIAPQPPPAKHLEQFFPTPPPIETTPRILVNGDPCPLEKRAEYDDLIAHATHQHEPPILATLPEILYISDNYIVVNKPPGIPCHPSGPYRVNTLLQMLSEMSSTFPSYKKFSNLQFPNGPTSPQPNGPLVPPDGLYGVYTELYYPGHRAWQIKKATSHKRLQDKIETRENYHDDVYKNKIRKKERLIARQQGVPFVDPFTGQSDELTEKASVSDDIDHVLAAYGHVAPLRSLSDWEPPFSLPTSAPAVDAYDTFVPAYYHKIFPKLFPVHRLDKVTSGVFLIARSQSATSRASINFSFRADKAAEFKDDPFEFGLSCVDPPPHPCGRPSQPPARKTYIARVLGEFPRHARYAGSTQLPKNITHLDQKQLRQLKLIGPDNKLTNLQGTGEPDGEWFLVSNTLGMFPLIDAETPNAAQAMPIEPQPSTLNTSNVTSMVRSWNSSLVDKLNQDGIAQQMEVNSSIPSPLHTYVHGEMRAKRTAQAVARSQVAVSIFRRISYDGVTSLVECQPLTGRTHQLRAHLWWLGHPIANDSDYGGYCLDYEDLHQTNIEAQSAVKAEKDAVAPKQNAKKGGSTASNIIKEITSPSPVVKNMKQQVDEFRQASGWIAQPLMIPSNSADSADKESLAITNQVEVDLFSDLFKHDPFCSVCGRDHWLPDLSVYGQKLEPHHFCHLTNNETQTLADLRTKLYRSRSHGIWLHAAKLEVSVSPTFGGAAHFKRVKQVTRLLRKYEAKMAEIELAAAENREPNLSPEMLNFEIDEETLDFINNTEHEKINVETPPPYWATEAFVSAASLQNKLAPARHFPTLLDDEEDPDLLNDGEDTEWLLTQRSLFSDDEDVINAVPLTPAMINARKRRLEEGSKSSPFDEGDSDFIPSIKR